jgi:hypothetical protein
MTIRQLVFLLQCRILGEGRRGDVEQLTSQEAIQLHEQLEIDIVALRRLAVRRLDVMFGDVDACDELKNPVSVSAAQILLPLSLRSSIQRAFTLTHVGGESRCRQNRVRWENLAMLGLDILGQVQVQNRWCMQGGE